MLQTKFCEGVDLKDLQRVVNEALSNLDSDNVVDIIDHSDQMYMIIKYVEKVRKLMCVDCQFYDSSGDPTRKAFGLCQFHGDRVRFSKEACSGFIDLR